jgi:hypothetical protein
MYQSSTSVSGSLASAWPLNSAVKVAPAKATFSSVFLYYFILFRRPVDQPV